MNLNETVSTIAFSDLRNRLKEGDMGTIRNIQLINRQGSVFTADTMQTEKGIYIFHLIHQMILLTAKQNNTHEPALLQKKLQTTTPPKLSFITANKHITHFFLLTTVNNKEVFK